MVVNASSLFTWIWAVVKPMINKRTLAKIRIVGTKKEDVLRCLEEIIPKEQIPDTYGGDLKFEDRKETVWKEQDYKLILGETPGETSARLAKGRDKPVYDGDSCRWFSDEERGFREWVYGKEVNWASNTNANDNANGKGEVRVPGRLG